MLKTGQRDEKSGTGVVVTATSNTADLRDQTTSKSYLSVVVPNQISLSYSTMKSLKMVICLALMVLATSKALEESEQTIGWGKAEASDEGFEGAENLAEELADQHMGIGSVQENLARI